MELPRKMLGYMSQYFFFFFAGRRPVASKIYNGLSMVVHLYLSQNPLRGNQTPMARWLDSIIDPMDVSFSKLWKIVKDREAWRRPRGHRESETTERLNNNNGKHHGNWEIKKGLGFLTEIPVSVHY